MGRRADGPCTQGSLAPSAWLMPHVRHVLVPGPPCPLPPPAPPAAPAGQVCSAGRHGLPAAGVAERRAALPGGAGPDHAAEVGAGGGTGRQAGRGSAVCHVWVLGDHARAEWDQGVVATLHKGLGTQAGMHGMRGIRSQVHLDVWGDDHLACPGR